MNIFFRLFKFVKSIFFRTEECEEFAFNLECNFLVTNDGNVVKVKKIINKYDFFCDDCNRDNKIHNLNLVEERLIEEHKEKAYSASFNGTDPNPTEEKFEETSKIIPEHTIYKYECSVCGSKAYSEQKF
jgi:hypothetical protein